MKKEIREGQRKGGLMKISEPIKLIRSMGGKIYACPAAMALHSLTRDDLIDEIDGVCSVHSFLADEARDAAIIYV